jgi:hypothetical protein
VELRGRTEASVLAVPLTADAQPRDARSDAHVRA